MANDFLISLRAGAKLLKEQGGEFVLTAPGARVPLGGTTPGIVAAIRRMIAGGATLGELSELSAGRSGGPGASQFLGMFSELEEAGLVRRTVEWKGRPFVTCVPLAGEISRGKERLARKGLYALSRFAYFRRQDRQIVLESPLAHSQIVLHHARAFSLLAALATPRSAAEGRKFAPGISPSVVRKTFELLAGAGFLSVVTKGGGIREEKNAALRQWEFHDLLFHSRSRAGRHGNPYGGVCRFPRAGMWEQAIKPAMSARKVSLYAPQIERLKKTDIPLTRVLEERRSTRNQGETSITQKELGEFLYRTARVRRVFRRSGRVVASRVYPGGGGAYELEIYTVIRSCEGLEPGLYQYLPLTHELCKISGGSREVEGLLSSAANTMQAAAPQVLLIFAARFRRVSWKYGSVAYAVILKDVGVLFQTMYLVATAMGLAACALGGGNSDLFERAAKLDYFSESSVGEFALGRAKGPEKKKRAKR